jgi:hypothetical protein
VKPHTSRKRGPTCQGCQHLNMDTDPPRCAKQHDLRFTSDLRCERGTRVEPTNGLCTDKRWRAYGE